MSVIDLISPSFASPDLLSQIHGEVKMLTYNWAKSSTGVYVPLRKLDLSNVNSVTGIYVIWHGGPKPHAVRLGQGLIGTRLSAHKKDNEVMAYEYLGTYLASWITPPAAYLDGIERYLADTLRPLVGTAFPNAEPIAVNLP